MNKHILHYANGVWTSGIPGYGDGITVEPNGTPVVVNSGGGIYSYNGSTWHAINDSLRPALAVAAAADGGYYMLSSQNVVGGNSPIYRVSGGGRLSLQPGSGKQIVASFDPATYVIPGVGNIAPEGYFVLKASGAIYYYSEDGSQSVRLPGAATSIAPVPGGFFALGNPQSASGARLYYFDYATGVTTAESAYFVSLAYAPNPERVNGVEARSIIRRLPSRWVG